MKTLSTLIAGAALAYSLAQAADWLCYRGDPGGSGWQRHEKALNAATVKGMQLLWKRQLGNQAKGLNSLTAPVMLRSIFTHRGVKELVFIAGASDNLYAVDADRGRVFWTRHFESAAAPDEKWPCGAGLTAAPAIAPPPAGASSSDEDEPSKILPPLYVLPRDGRLRTLRPSDGQDMAAPLRLVPANANAAGLIADGESVSTTTSHGCGGAADGVWTIRAGNPDAKTRFDPASGGVSDGHMATWEDAAGARLTYSATQSAVAAFKGAGKTGKPVWTSPLMTAPLSLAVANGLVYVLAGSTLYALNAATGEQLYSSKDLVTSATLSGGLAIANGHVCFGAADTTLYCFGLPLEI